MEYKAFEMHTHTMHSDGKFTVEELCHAAKNMGFEAIALTDHNTISAYEQLTCELEAKTLPVIRGIEWTTFFGHMLVLGCENHVDWRLATPHNIDEYLQEIHRQNGVLGIAHPFSLGSPFCTGCHWSFNVKNLEQIDYIEIWSEAFAQNNPINARALQWWTDLLNRGFHIAATQGRDWHGPSKNRENMTATYLGIEGIEINTQTAQDALRKGRSYVTCGPTISFDIEQNGFHLGLGETIKPGQATAHISTNLLLRHECWSGFGIAPKKLQIIHNGAPLKAVCCESLHSHSLQLAFSPGWVRLELLGDYMGKEDILLAFTSPIYVAY